MLPATRHPSKNEKSYSESTPLKYNPSILSSVLIRPERQATPDTDVTPGTFRIGSAYDRFSEKG